MSWTGCRSINVRRSGPGSLMAGLMARSPLSLKPRRWWCESASAAGWRDCGPNWRNDLDDPPRDPRADPGRRSPPRQRQRVDVQPAHSSMAQVAAAARPGGSRPGRVRRAGGDPAQRPPRHQPCSSRDHASRKPTTPRLVTARYQSGPANPTPRPGMSTATTEGSRRHHRRTTRARVAVRARGPATPHAGQPTRV